MTTIIQQIIMTISNIISTFNDAFQFWQIRFFYSAAQYVGIDLRVISDSFFSGLGLGLGLGF